MTIDAPVSSQVDSMARIVGIFWSPLPPGERDTGVSHGCNLLTTLRLSSTLPPSPNLLLEKHAAIDRSPRHRGVGAEGCATGEARALVQADGGVLGVAGFEGEAGGAAA